MKYNMKESLVSIIGMDLRITRKLKIGQIGLSPITSLYDEVGIKGKNEWDLES